MQAEFWREKWESNQIGFHERQVNPILTDNIDKLGLKAGARIFLPLCGKTLDIRWLLSQGFRVVGVELVELAIEQLFSELKLEPKRSQQGEFTHYSAQNLDIYVGDIFKLNKQILKRVDAVYDRAAFVALAEPMRQNYVELLAEVTARAPQLLVTHEYDKTKLNGPPFSFSDNEIAAFYTPFYNLNRISTVNIEGGLKGHPAREHIWRLTSGE